MYVCMYIYIYIERERERYRYRYTHINWIMLAGGLGLHPEAGGAAGVDGRPA